MRLSSRSALAWRAAPVALLLAAAACSDLAPPPAQQAPIAKVSSGASLVGLVTFYGPERFTRRTGKPQAETRTIATAGFEALFTLHVRNGNPDGSNRVSSATVSLDGATLLSQSDFNQQAGGWDIPVSLGASAVISVALASAPNSFLEISIDGKRSGTLFCPTGGPGVFTDLQAAINATDPDGTVLVCDGEWNIPQAHVNRPLTIRSQNPGGATLGDTISSGGGQLSPPALWIDSVPSGLVRLADIGFAMRGRGVVLGNFGAPYPAYDRVEIDSAWFIGRNTNSAFGVETFGSSVPGAVTEFTNSHCMHVNICVFATQPTPVNVRHSRFDSSAVLYTTNNTPGNFGQGTTEDNDFVHCQRVAGGCITIFSREGTITLRNNRITMHGPNAMSSSFGAITVSRGLGPTPNGLVVIEDNVVISHATGGPPATPAGWQLPTGIAIGDGPGVTYVVRNNRVTDAFRGFSFNGSTIATDNTVTGGVLAFQQGAGATVLTFQRNDAVGMLSSFTASPASATSNYQCNWWGSAAGPTTPPPLVPASRYTPFSPVPIANQPGVVCP